MSCIHKSKDDLTPSFPALTPLSNGPLRWVSQEQITLVLALVLALMMVLGSVSALAGSVDEPETTSTSTGKTIALTGGKAGHTYTLYQIFTGDVEDDKLINIQWGADAPADYKAGYPTAAAAAKAASDDNNARTWALGLTLTGGTPLTLNADGTVEFSGLAEGYYVITDTNNNTSAVDGDYDSAIIVKVVSDVTGAMKGDAPTSEKKVKDSDDTAGTETDYQDTADYDIGDAVPFQLKATTAGNAGDYKKYHITFQDELSDGLDMPTAWKITVMGETFDYAGSKLEKTTGTTKITVEPGTAKASKGFAIKVTFESTTAGAYLGEAVNGKDIIVQYTSVLNTSAKFGVEGNPNTSYIQYSRNPDSTNDSEEGETPEDTVLVFTYKTVIDKVDETGKALKGANFTLYKEVAAGTQGAVLGSALTFDEGVEHSAIIGTKSYIVVSQKTGTSADSQFGFNGIDDGTYVLVETTVPVGYNAYKSETVTVSATHTSDGDTPATTLTALTATSPFSATNVGTGTVEATKKDNTKHTVTSGEAYAEIENKSGATLPETGGVGTTIFYIAGSILVLAAAVLLVTKRRMGNND